MKLLRRKLDERGDTLVEVTIALAILSSVLIGAYVISSRAFIQGETANERSFLSSEAQQQAEALQSFRNSHTWDQFIYGNTAAGRGPSNACNNPIGGQYCGIHVRFAPPRVPGSACFAGGNTVCFHMELHTVTPNTQPEWIPVHGPYDGSLGSNGTSSLIMRPPLGMLDPQTSYTFVIFYGVDSLGSYGNPSGRQNSTLYLTLGDLDGLRQP